MLPVSNIRLGFVLRGNAGLNFLPLSLSLNSGLLRQKQHLVAMAREVERPSENRRVTDLISPRGSVFEQDTEPITAPDEAVATLHDFLHHHCMNVSVNGGREQHCKAL